MAPAQSRAQDADFVAFDPTGALEAQKNQWREQPAGMLNIAILGGLQLATTAFSEGDAGLRAALHTPEEPPSHRACSQRLWCPL